MAINVDNLIGTPSNIWTAETVRSAVKNVNNVVLATDVALTTLVALTPLGKNTITGHYHVFNAAAIDGTEVISAFVPYTPDAPVVINAVTEINSNVAIEADIEYGEIPAVIAGKYNQAQLDTALKLLSTRQSGFTIRHLQGV